MSEAPDSRSARGPLLELEDVSFAYESGSAGGPVAAVRGASLSLCAGSIHGLVGVNGAGKTTLLELVAGVRAPDAGRVSILGRAAGPPRRRSEMLEAVGFCRDVPALPSRLTVAEILRCFASLKGLARTTAAERIDFLAPFLGLGDMADRRVEELSRGNLVRAGVALAVLGDPDLLLLDESFGPLDPLVRRDLRALLRSVADAGTAILVSSHQLEQLEKVVDTVHVMHQGVLTGPFGPDQFRSQRYLRVRLGRLDRQKREELRERFPGSTLLDDTLLVPWSEGRGDGREVADRLSADGYPRAVVAGTVERSLESVLAEVVEGTRPLD